ncbi:hypothetical protein LNKW23_14360 [Paralimibaculum aggregatum]|uniref:Uncharacterized protein n=1 Tax=Paralimibaculum aggregatum TaxID=3036245 RepID=A0ABQ6LN19_9RHOB|nr:hypothetical protein LNKW23_14360 [Limibaculum sp. NKW23]
MFGVILVVAGSGLADVNPPTVDMIDPPARLHVTEAGVRVEMPELAGLSCEEMRAVLWRLDRTGYRGQRVLDPSHPDWRVFVYEDRLAAALYFDCTLRASRESRQVDVFSRGFGAR